MAQGHGLDLGALVARIEPQPDQMLDFADREAELAGAADEAQRCKASPS